MFSPAVAIRLRDLGYEVTAVVTTPELRAQPDSLVHAWAIEHGCVVVTENVRDYRPLLHQSQRRSEPYSPLLLISTRRFARSRGSLTRLVQAIDLCLRDEPEEMSAEIWL